MRSTITGVPVRVVLVGLVGAALLGACQLRTATDIVVAADGSGELALEVALDQELVDLLREAGLEPLDGLAELQERAPGWSVTTSEDEGLDVTLRAGFDDPAGFERLSEDLHAALDPADGALYRNLRLSVSDDGSVRFSGELGLLLPAAAGAEGTGVRFDMDDVRRLLRERGEELVRHELRLTLPAEPTSHNADVVIGRSLIWRAPVDDLRPVSAASPPPPAGGLLATVAVGVVAAAGAALVVVAVRRRLSRRAVRPGR